MRSLIDLDMVLYQTAFSAQFTPKPTEDNPEPEQIILPFEQARAIVDNLIADIVEASGSTEWTGYLTGKGNFREEIAKKKTYKGTRKEEKPFHYENIKAYMIHSLGAVVVDGMEADDAMAIAQWEDWRGCWDIDEAAGNDYFRRDDLSTIICTRDKDLRMVPGLHYSWECYNQPEVFPFFVSEFGELVDRPKKVQGNGLMFFYFQCLTGDSVDNIPGCPGIGPKKALKALIDCETEMELYQVVLGMYEEKYAESASEELLEQARLVWMVRELNEDGSPVMWEAPDVT